jgi:hypothetical protein
MYCTTPAALVLQLLDASGNITDSLDLMDQNNGYRVASLDVGFPAVREVKAALPTRDGDYDTTALFGPRVITVTGSLVPSPQGGQQQAWATLARWCQPRLRPQLVYQVDAAMAPLTIGLRGSQLSGPFTHPAVAAFSVSWVAPNPVAYGRTVNQLTVQPQQTAATGGRAYPLTFPRTYPAPSPGGSGQGTIVNAGNYPTWPTFRIYGLCTGPAIWWVTPAGPAIVFLPSLTVNAGDYLEVNTFAQTAYVNGSAAASRFASLDFTQTVWQPCYAGSTVIRFAPATFSAPCQLVALWNDASL